MNIFSTAYAPPINYIALAAKHKNIEIEIFEYFEKQSIRNHCNIASANGLQKLTIPLANRKNKTHTKDIKISYAEAWNVFHKKALQTAYNNSPFFEYYFYQFEPFYNKKFEYLIDFNQHLLSKILVVLKLTIEVKETQSYLNNTQLENNFMELENLQITNETNEYYQVFKDKNGFIPNLSIFDLLFNEGPQAAVLLAK